VQPVTEFNVDVDGQRLPILEAPLAQAIEYLEHPPVRP